MLKGGVLNPAMNHLLARFRHTNLVVIADRAFPFWPTVETVDLALTKDIPRVTDVLRVMLPLVTVGTVWMAEEFKRVNREQVIEEFAGLVLPNRIVYEPHVELKRRVPGAIGLIRTGDATPYANVILQSA